MRRTLLSPPDKSPPARGRRSGQNPGVDLGCRHHHRKGQRIHMLAESAVGDDVSVSVYRHGGWRADNSLTMSWRFLERAQRMACVGRRLHSTAKRVDAGSCAASTRIRAEGRRDALLAKKTRHCTVFDQTSPIISYLHSPLTHFFSARENHFDNYYGNMMLLESMNPIAATGVITLDRCV